MNWLTHWLVASFAIFASGYLVPGVHVHGVVPAFVGAVVLGVLNVLVRPLLVLFTLPITVLTLGGFLLIINGMMFSAAAAITGGMSVDGFLSAFLAALLVAVVSTVANVLIEKPHAV